MTARLLNYAFLFISLTSACSMSAPAHNENPTANDSSQPDAQNQALLKHLAQIARAVKGRVGVSAMVRETGNGVSLNPPDHFRTQIVYKLPISMAVMRQVDAGKIKLDQKVPVTKDGFIGL